MPVQTRNQIRQQQINQQQLGSTVEPVIMAANEPAAGKPTCYLAWGRFLTEKQYHASCGKTAKEVTMMMASKEKPDAKGPRCKKAVYAAMKGQTENQDECAHCPQETTHGLAWTANVHYMSIGGQCGQSCGCCRADVYKSGLDEDAKWGACSICLST